MTSHNFQPFSEPNVQSCANSQTSDHEASSIQALAEAMQQAKQRLLKALLETPATVTRLSPPIEQADEQDSDYVEIGIKVVQEWDFVQDKNLETEDKPTQPNPECPFWAPELIEMTKQVQSACDADDAQRLAAYCIQLQTSRQQMISANSGLVAFVANKYKTNSLGFDDLMQEGTIGLIRAVDRFDPYRGIRFSTYAIFWIKQAISRLIVKQDKVVRLPVSLAEKASTVFEAMRSTYLEHNRWPKLHELQSLCDLTADEVKTISEYYQATHSLDASLSGDEDDQTLMSRLKQQQFALPLDELIDRNLSLYLSKVVASLPEKEAAILNMRFGLKNHTEMTLQAIADQLHVTRERVRQIQNQALKKLKQQFGYELLPFLEANDQ